MKANTNSLGDFYVAVLCGVYHDMVGAILPQSEVRRDVVEIRRRACQEGIGFFTKTLPRLGKALDRALGQGTRLQFSGFKRSPGTQLPAFGRMLFSVLFTDEGTPRQAKPGGFPRCEAVDHLNPGGGSGNASDPGRETMIMALRALRQITYLCYKVELPYREAQVSSVLESFKETERDLKRRKPFKCLSGSPGAVAAQARRLVCRVLANAEPYGGLPKHGPGSVSTGESSPEKHRFTRLYKRLDRRFNWSTWFQLNLNHTIESVDSGDLARLKEESYGIAKVVLVPKDSRGPRLISAEPLAYQWIQQALLSVLVPTIERHPLTRGHVNFSNQEVNRALALEGSATGRWVTLDMKDASDRVSLRAVKALFPTRWFEALFASRTPKTRLPDGTLVTMRKFAPMGSAVCFPVEAIVFWSLSVAALMIHKHMPLRKAASRVFVYGDDIVCDVEDHDVITQCLEQFALKVNRDKCCTAGFFRESCGMDAFHGSSVTPLKLRQPWSSSLKPRALISYIEFSNQMYERGCFVTAEIVERYIQAQARDSVPVVSNRFPSCHCFIRPYACTRTQPRGVKTRWNARFHRQEVRGLALRPASGLTRTAGYPLLLRLLTESERRRPSQSFLGTELDRVELLPPRTGQDKTGYFAIAHREKPTRAWTPAG